MTYAQHTADPTNVVGRRIGAYAIDLLLMVLLAGAIIVPVFLSALETAPAGTVDCETDSSFDGDTTFDQSPNASDRSFCFDDGDEVRYIPVDEEGSITAQAYGIVFGIQALNLVVLQGLTGASLGKAMVGLRVIRQDGQKAGIGWAALRWLLLFVDSLCFFLPGVVLVFVTKGHRRIGDMAASTFVVRKESVGTQPQVPGVTAPAWPVGGQPGYQGAQGQVPGGWPAGPAAPAGWAGPPTGQAGTWAPSDAATPADAGGGAGGEGPTWDAARNAYIQYDRDASAWVQWSDDAGQWRPIDQ